MAAPVIMVHGAFCGGWAFDRFRAPFEAAGHLVLTPDLRGHEAGARAGDVVGVSMSDYADDIARLCRRQPQPPILIGHSMGGLVAQMAAMNAETAALVLLAPSPSWGGSASSMEEAVSAFGLQFLGPYWAQAVPPDEALARGYSLDRFPKQEQRALFAKMRPESGRAIFETLNWWLDPFMTTRVDPGRLKTPILALAGGRDAIHPAATVRMSAARIGATFRQFPEMSHWLPGEPGWDEVSGAVLDWTEDAVRVAA